jgi:serine/threonine protein kinase
MLTVTICVLSLCVQVHERSTADGLFPEAKLLDFGLSKMVGEDFGSAAKTFVGTPSYMPPEVPLTLH